MVSLKKWLIIKASDSLFYYYLFWSNTGCGFVCIFVLFSLIDQIWSTQRHTCNEEVTFVSFFFPRCHKGFILTWPKYKSLHLLTSHQLYPSLPILCENSISETQATLEYLNPTHLLLYSPSSCNPAGPTLGFTHQNPNHSSQLSIHPPMLLKSTDWLPISTLVCILMVKVEVAQSAAAHQLPIKLDSPGRDTGVRSCHFMCQGGLPGTPGSNGSPTARPGRFASLAHQGSPSLMIHPQTQESRF